LTCPRQALYPFVPIFCRGTSRLRSFLKRANAFKSMLSLRLFLCCNDDLTEYPPAPATQSCLRPGAQQTRERAGNPGFSRIRFRLRTPGSPKLRCKSPKVSGRVRKYSRFAETIGGDWFDHHCRPRAAVASRRPTRCAVSAPLYRKHGRYVRYHSEDFVETDNPDGWLV
jgi:hypothetical protein